jgi:cell division transport system permease protein
MRYALREALSAFRRSPLLTGLSVVMIGLALFVLGLFAVAAHNIQLVLNQVEARVEVVAYLRDDATGEEVDALRADLAALPGVRDVIHISRRQALELARLQLQEFGAIFADLAANPFPASLEVTVHPGQKGPELVHRIAETAAGYPFVEDVRFGQEWLDMVYLLRRIAAAAALVVGGAFALVAALIIGATIRLSIFARRDEIEIMRMVGATNGFVRRPFLLEGLITGALGALLALPALYLVFRLLSGSIWALAWIPDSWIALGLVAGCLFGTGASLLAMRRHLREL